MPGLKAFVAAVFGGIGSIPGAVIGAFIIGICENLIKSSTGLYHLLGCVHLCAADSDSLRQARRVCSVKRPPIRYKEDAGHANTDTKETNIPI